MKHEWRKKEKSIYIPKAKPELVKIPELKYLTIEGEGNPASQMFADCIQALYSVSYAIKMTLKKRGDVAGYMDYTVYPLEGVWSLNEEAIKTFDGNINKDDFVFKIMIRQPDFVSDEFVKEMIEFTKGKKPQELLSELKFETISEGPCVQMLHIGSYDNEPATFKLMESFAEENNLKRLSMKHREVYISDFRRVAPEKLKTTLRFKVSEME